MIIWEITVQIHTARIQSAILMEQAVHTIQVALIILIALMAVHSAINQQRILMQQKHRDSMTVRGIIKEGSVIILMIRIPYPIHTTDMEAFTNQTA